MFTYDLLSLLPFRTKFYSGSGLNVFLQDNIVKFIMRQIARPDSALWKAFNSSANLERRSDPV